METITAREARKTLSTLLTEAENGHVISITRRGHEVARLVPPDMAENINFPNMSEFRNSIKLKGKATSELIIEMRNEERY